MDPRRAWPWYVATALAVGAVVGFLAARLPETLEGEDGILRLVELLAWLGLVSAGLVFYMRTRPGAMLRHLAVWVAIGAALVGAYSFRHELGAIKERMLGELVPHRGTVEGGSVTFRAREGGHFVVEAEVEGRALRFLVDTGASDVVLSPGDARRIGIDPAALAYTRRYSTANGTGFGAPVVLKSLRVGPIELADVPASVNRAEMRTSLLGMSFLGRLKSYEVRDGALTLRR